jgi:hypothetical protein
MSAAGKSPAAFSMHPPDEISLFAGKLNRLGVPYMVTGATAAIVYGQPRVTNDIDVVLALDVAAVSRLADCFPETEFYIPPDSVLRVEQGRRQRGHFNIIHHESGYKADVYLAGEDPLHVWALPLRRTLSWSGEPLTVAPPEYVIVRKLEYFREGGSPKHLQDIRAMLAVTEVDRAEVMRWVETRGLGNEWAQV